jgi:hypothetical protein
VTDPDVTDPDATPAKAPASTLNAAVRRRRADQSFFVRISKAIAQNHRALERLSR